MALKSWRSNHGAQIMPLKSCRSNHGAMVHNRSENIIVCTGRYGETDLLIISAIFSNDIRKYIRHVSRIIPKSATSPGVWNYRNSYYTNIMCRIMPQCNINVRHYENHIFSETITSNPESLVIPIYRICHRNR